MFKLLDKKITTTLFQIENKKVSPADSGIGKLLNKMKDIDEPAYDKYFSEYKRILDKIKASKD
jgi:hypothetical protein